MPKVKSFSSNRNNSFASSLILPLVITLVLLTGALAVVRVANQPTSRDSASAANPHLTENYVSAFETDPVPSTGDAADDVAIWVNPKDRTKSVVIGTDKRGGGLLVYDLKGKQKFQVSKGLRLSNVDLRDNFPLGNQKVTLVAASDRTDKTKTRIRAYKLNPADGSLSEITTNNLNLPYEAYGLCLYNSKVNGKFYAFVTANGSGTVGQYELVGEANGQVTVTQTPRTFPEIKSQSEGCVADDEMNTFYLGEETVGVWKYEAEPTSRKAGTMVDAVANGRLFADIEGITLALENNGRGYMLVSSQGDHSFAVYRRDGKNEFVKKFKVVDGNGLDGVTESDGVEITTANLGAPFTQGLLVVQDGGNDKGNQNFKLIDWGKVIKGTPNANSSLFDED